MHKIILYIISVLTVFTSCTTTDVPDKVSLQPQVMNDSLLTTMPGDLLLIDDYLVWSDPFSDNKFLHVHRSSDGKYIGSMGQKGEGPQEFVSPLINRFSINRCIAAHDANGKTRGYLSIDSLIVGKEPFMSLSDFDRNIRMAKLDEQLYLTETENGENDYFKVSSNGKKSTFGVYPIVDSLLLVLLIFLIWLCIKRKGIILSYYGNACLKKKTILLLMGRLGLIVA